MVRLPFSQVGAMLTLVDWQSKWRRRHGAECSENRTDEIPAGRCHEAVYGEDADRTDYSPADCGTERNDQTDILPSFSG